MIEQEAAILFMFFIGAGLVSVTAISCIAWVIEKLIQKFKRKK